MPSVLCGDKPKLFEAELCQCLSGKVFCLYSLAKRVGLELAYWAYLPAECTPNALAPRQDNVGSGFVVFGVRCSRSGGVAGDALGKCFARVAIRAHGGGVVQRIGPTIRKRARVVNFVCRRQRCVAAAT